MPEKVRRANARAAASKYAPRPDGSTMTYGLISLSLLAVALAAFGGFYEADMLAVPVPLAVSLLAAFAFGAGWRFFQQRRHKAAYEAEYELRQPGPARD